MILDFVFVATTAMASTFSMEFERESLLRQGSYRPRDPANPACVGGDLTFRNVASGRIDLMLGGQALARHVGDDAPWTDVDGCAKKTITKVEAGQIEVTTDDQCGGRAHQDILLILVSSGGFTYRQLRNGRSLVCALVRL